MLDLKAKLNELLDLCHSTYTRYEEARITSEDKSVAADKKLAEVKAMIEELRVRSGTIQEQENRLLRHDQLDDKAAAHEDSAMQLSKEREKFEADYKVRYDDLTAREGALADGNAKLQAAQKQLSDDRQSYKKEIMDAIANDATTRATIAANAKSEAAT